MRKNLQLLKIFAFSIFLIIFGCREEMDWANNQRDSLRAEKFFSYEKSKSRHANVTLVDSLVQKLKQTNKEKDFLSKISDQYGIPNWDYLVGTDIKVVNSANRGSGDVEMLVIPLVREENEFLTSLMYVENPDSENPKIYTVTNEELETFVRNEQIEKNIREEVLLTFLSFDRRMFGDRSYSAIPKELFEKVHIGEGKDYKSFKISVPEQSNPHGRQIMECINIYACVGGGSCETGVCDLCTLCVTKYCYSYSSGGSSGDSGSTGDPSDNGGGGGSSGSSGPTIPWYVANPNIYNYNGNVRAIFVQLYNKNIQLQDEELDFLESHNDVTMGFKSYLSNITLEKAQFTKWGIEFLLNNPDMTWEQFQSLFMKTPCENLKTTTNDEKFKSNVTILESKTGDSFESGFRLGTPVANSGQTGTQNQILQNKQGTKEVNMTIFNNTFALMHSHYDGLYPIFSPGDILLFNQWLVWAKNYNDNPASNPKIPINALTLTVVTSSGNYMLNFDGINVVQLPNYSQQEFEKLNNEYQDKYLDKTHTNGNFDMEKVESEFLKFVKNKMNMAGLKLFKVSSSSSNTEIYLENGSRKTRQCP